MHFCRGLQQRQHIFSGTVIYFIGCITSFRCSWHPFTPCAYCEPLPTFTIVYAHCFLPFLEAYVCCLLNMLLHMPYSRLKTCFSGWVLQLMWVAASWATLCCAFCVLVIVDGCWLGHTTWAFGHVLSFKHKHNNSCLNDTVRLMLK